MLKLKRVLFATDLRPGSQSQLLFIAGLCRDLGATLDILHVVNGPSRGESKNARTSEEIRLELDRLCLGACLGRVDAKTHLRSGRPAHEISQFARSEKVGLIAMGTRARGHLTQALLGSVAENVARTACCPVLVLPPGSTDVKGHRLKEIAQLLAAEFGPGVVGPRDESRARMITLLTRQPGISDADAALMLDGLEEHQGLIWHEGQSGSPNSQFWAIDPDVIADDDARPQILAPEATAPENAAIDLLQHAISNNASDIHIDPAGADEFEVRLRIDGRVEHYCHLGRTIAAPLIQQMKLLAGLDISDPFKPQEGRLELPTALQMCDVRITTAPVADGQAMALRLFDGQRSSCPLEELGISGPGREAVEQMLRLRSGLLLVTGSTGSGKTTTIYSLLHQLSKRSPNIISVEDPVEYRLPFVRQVAVDPRHGVSMTSGLRTILRMDPDVVFLGEIRDGEAADIAMRAASAGRLVLSTLHTRDVASTITALRDLHVDGRSLGANLAGLVSQRLVRRLCRECARLEDITQAERDVFLAAGLTPPEQLRKPVGCDRCRRTGYRGRIGLFEIVATSRTAADAIVAGVSETEFGRVLSKDGFRTMHVDGLTKVAEGLTTLEEVSGL